MANLTIKVNLAKLDGASLQTNPNTNKRALIIPVDEADLFVSDRGAVYLDLVAWENHGGVPDQYGNTHSVKKSYSRGVRERLGADTVKNKPFLGSVKNMPEFNSNTGTPAPAPQTSNYDNW